MKKNILIISLYLLFCSAWVVGAQSLVGGLVELWTFQNGAVTTSSPVSIGGSLTLREYTVATLPTGLSSGALALITDGDDATDCITGGGSSKVTCRYSGSAWANAGDGIAAGGIADVTAGGTGRATGTTAYSLVATGTTATGAQQTLANGATTQVLVGGGASALPAWGTDLPTAVTIGSAYIYRAGGTDVPDADVADNITITAGSQIASGSPTFTAVTATNIFSPTYDVTGAADITIGSADVTKVTLSGQSEDLVFTPSTNTWTASSSTGVTDISLGSLNLATTGTILGAVNIVTTTDGALSPTAAQMYGTMFIADHATATSDTDYTLPSAVKGMVGCYYDNGGGTGGIIIDAATDDEILLNGTGVGVADAIDSPGVAGDGENGDFICLMAIDATYWITLGRSGTWVDGGAD